MAASSISPAVLSRFNLAYAAANDLLANPAFLPGGDVGRACVLWIAMTTAAPYLLSVRSFAAADGTGASVISLLNSGNTLVSGCVYAFPFPVLPGRSCSLFASQAGNLDLLVVQNLELGW